MVKNALNLHLIDLENTQKNYTQAKHTLLLWIFANLEFLPYSIYSRPFSFITAIQRILVTPTLWFFHHQAELHLRQPLRWMKFLYC